MTTKCKNDFVRSAQLALFSLIATSLPVIAEFDPDQGGMTEIIQCLNSTWDICPIYHDNFYWGGSGPDITYTSPEGWWNYAEPGLSSLNCAQWINGSIVGGATYEAGEPSVPQGVDVTINTHWWDFTNADFFTTCSHAHASTYVWGWRYNGTSWMREFVTAHTRSAYLNDDGICTFQAEGNPDYPEGFEQFAFGPEALTITDSPYAVLYTKSQSNSHFSAGCGQHQCFHRTRVRVNYSGGPGTNKGELRFETPTDELTIGSSSDNNLNPESFTRNTDKIKGQTSKQYSR